jgi:predicted site-specific integrase-resolvase
MTERQPLATPKEVGEYLSVPATTLRQWRYHGTGPKWMKVNSMVRYDWDNVEAWLEASRRASEKAEASR